MKGPKTRIRSGWYFVLVAIGSLAVLRFYRQPADPVLQPVIVFSNSYQFPSPPPSLFARWVPATPGWTWLWRLKEAVGGKIKPVEIDTDIISICERQSLELGSPSFNGSGSMDASRMRVWLLERADLNSLHAQLKTNPDNLFLNSPRIVTGDGIGAEVFVGQTMVLNGATKETGVRVSYFTRVRREVLDLMASVSLVDPLTNEAQVIALRTNLDLKARLQLPKGKVMFLMHTMGEGTNQSRIGLILSTKP